MLSKSSARASRSNKMNAKTIMNFTMYNAGKPPGSGDVSLIAKELLAYRKDALITTRHQGIRNKTTPRALTRAFFFAENPL